MMLFVDSRLIFRFFKILIFRVVRRVKGQKMAQNDKKLCLSYSVSQEPYLHDCAFLVRMYEMMISLVIFSLLQNFDFLGF